MSLPDLEKRSTIPGQNTEVAIARGDDMEPMQAVDSRAASPDRCEPSLNLRMQRNLHLSAAQDVHALADETPTPGADIVWVSDLPFGSTALVRENAGNLVEFLSSHSEPALARQHTTENL